MYSVTGLKELPDSDRGSARPGGMNNSGQVVGWASFTHPRATLDQAFLWSEGVIQALGFLTHRDISEAHAINDRGLVVGWSGGAPFLPHAFLWNELTGMEDLGTPDQSSLDASSDSLFSTAHAINNSGEVVGVSGELGGSSGNHAFIWRRSTGPHTLRELPDRQLSEARAINNSGQVVGSSSTPGDRHAFIWSGNTGMEDLGTLPNFHRSEAHAINNSGEVVGWSSFANTDRHAFIWSGNTGMEDLGTLPDREFSEAHAINNSGEVVGVSFSPFFGQEERSKHAFIWSESTRMEDLNVLLPPNSGWELIRAQDINDSGQILCEGFHTGPDNARERRLCVLTPS